MNFYKTLYNVIGQEESAWVAEMQLDLAESILSLPKKQWAEAQIFESVKAWLNLKKPGFLEKPGFSAEGELLDALDSALTIDDLSYVEKLNSCLDAVGKNRHFSVVNSCYNRGIQRCKEEKYLAAIDDFNQVIQINPDLADANYNRGLAYAKLGQYQAAIEDYTQVLRLNPNNANACNNRANAYYKLGDYERAIADYNQALSINPNLPEVAHNRDVAQEVWDEKKRQQCEEEERRKVEEEEKKQKQREEEEAKGQEFHFEIITVNDQGKEISRKPGKARQKLVDLGNGINLEMVDIPGGTFQMGSSEYSGEQPVHQVTIKPFFMGKYPITQEQWQAVMGNNPSSFKAAKRPVENVSWQDAIAFCAKLSQKTGKNYRLPSEAEWEYACRAGTTTPFHFGETITPDLVNYDGNNPYAWAPKGLYRQETTPVGSFPPNAFGLYDMHGNVWEWCSDRWHDNYNDAPTDGSSWETGGSDYRVQRGGSWDDDALLCRSAYRIRYALGNGNRVLGFRVVLASGFSAF